MQRASPIDDGSGEPLADRRLETAARDSLEGSEARRKLIECLTGWGCARVDDVALVFSEMVTNAVLHGGGAVLISAHLVGDGDHLRLEVHDREAASPVPCSGGPAGGYGLTIIDRLSERWGTTPSPNGKMVWAEMRIGLGPEPGDAGRSPATT